MKRILLSTLLCCAMTCGFSQINFGAGTQIIFDGSAFGAQGKVLYEYDDSWRGAGTFTFHFDNFIDWTIDLDAQYKLIKISDNFDLAPLAGISFSKYSVGSDVGINLGAFIDFVPSDSYHIYLEPKINISGYESFALAGGILF